jgi:hypothetical protein
MGTGDLIARRHVFYIEGYDPQGIPGYYRLFRRELARFLQLWPVKLKLSEPEVDADGIAGRWYIETTGPNWQVATTYEFLRWDDIIVRDMSRPMWVRVPRIVLCFLEYLFNGTIIRVFRAGWRFGLFYLYPTISLLAAVAIPTILGLFSARWVFSSTNGRDAALGLATATAAAVGYLAARKLCKRWFVIQLSRLGTRFAAGLHRSHRYVRAACHRQGEGC